MRYIKNHTSNTTYKVEDLISLSKNYSIPKDIKTKADLRSWQANPSTDHVFLSPAEGNRPEERITADNPPVLVYSLILDYDVPYRSREFLYEQLAKVCSIQPSYLATTFSNCYRLIWEFETPIRIDERLYEGFMSNLGKSLSAIKIGAGLDRSSYKPGQYFDIGNDVEDLGNRLDDNTVRSALCRASLSRDSMSNEINIPIEVISAEVEKKFPGRWKNTFDVGARGPLFWINDGVEREGCVVRPDGMTVFSDREHRGFLSWSQIFGEKFIEEYTVAKTAPLLGDYWFDGENFYRRMNNIPNRVPESQVKAELLERGFSPKGTADKPLSELGEAVLRIQQLNRVHAAAPVLYSKNMVIRGNGSIILNTNQTRAVTPAETGDPEKWPWLDKWLSQLFVRAGDPPALDYFYSWLSRFYVGTLNRDVQQGQALLLVGPSGRGKSLLSNRVIGGLVGGFEDASRFLSGKTAFSKKLTGVGLWAIDDAIAASTFRDQQLMTEMLKKTVANPRVEYEPKFVDSVTIPWGGRVVMSLNEDANSLAVVPSLDSSNRDKTIALKVSDEATSKFPANTELEATIAKELPYFGRFLEDWEVPDTVGGSARFGVKEYIAPSIEAAAFHNSSRSGVAEIVDLFCSSSRGDEVDNPTPWVGTTSEFISQAEGLGIRIGSRPEFIRRGMAAMEEAHRSNPKMRPVISQGSGAGVFWILDRSVRYDIVGKKTRQELIAETT